MTQPKLWHRSGFSVTPLCRLDIPRQTNLTFREWRSSLLMNYICWMTNQGTNMLKCQNGKLLKIWRSFQKCVWETLLLWVPLRQLSGLEESIFVHRKFYPIHLFQHFEILIYIATAARPLFTLLSLSLLFYHKPLGGAVFKGWRENTGIFFSP